MTFWIVVTVVLAGSLAVFTIFAEYVGLAGVFGRQRYEQCPRCHHHYLSTSASPDIHRCPHGAQERVFQWTRTRLNHSPRPH